METFEAGPTYVTAPEKPSLPRWRKVGLVAAGAVGVVFAGVAVDEAIVNSCHTQMSMEPAFTPGPTEGFCDWYEGFKESLPSIPDQIVSKPVFDVNANDFKIFSPER